MNGAFDAAIWIIGIAVIVGGAIIRHCQRFEESGGLDRVQRRIDGHHHYRGIGQDE